MCKKYFQARLIVTGRKMPKKKNKKTEKEKEKKMIKEMWVMFNSCFMGVYLLYFTGHN